MPKIGNGGQLTIKGSSHNRSTWATYYGVPGHEDSQLSSTTYLYKTAM